MPQTSSAFDGIDGEPASSSTVEYTNHFRPSAFPRRLTPDTLAALRRRRTGPARGLRRPLKQSRRGYDEEDEEDDEYEDEEEDESLFSILCCWCVGPRCCVATCMLVLSLIVWNWAIAQGILRQPSYDQMVTPIRVARQRLTHKKPTGADDGFILFDRNADGLIDKDDMAIVARLTTGEHPSEEQLRAYIAKGDLNGDGALDEPEYHELLRREREDKAKKKGHEQH